MVFPGKRITVKLAPADIRKAGLSYDLPIAVGVMVASEQYPPILRLLHHQRRLIPGRVCSSASTSLVR
jgi:predicted ATPase with chaperone activity